MMPPVFDETFVHSVLDTQGTTLSQLHFCTSRLCTHDCPIWSQHTPGLKITHNWSAPHLPVQNSNIEVRVRVYSAVPLSACSSGYIRWTVGLAYFIWSLWKERLCSMAGKYTFIILQIWWASLNNNLQFTIYIFRSVLLKIPCIVFILLPCLCTAPFLLCLPLLPFISQLFSVFILSPAGNTAQSLALYVGTVMGSEFIISRP